MTKKLCLVHFTSQEPYIIWLSFMVHLCKMISPVFFFFFFFFHFFKILILWVVMGYRGDEKIARNDKKLCLSCSISQEPYIILSFVVHKCKMISPGVFLIFSKFWFFGLLGESNGKNGPKWQKTLSFALYISGTIHHMILIYGTHV